MRPHTLVVGGAEFKALIAAQTVDLLARWYAADEADGMNLGRFKASWMPAAWRKRQAIAGLINGKIVGWIHLLVRQDGVALLESLFVHPDKRGGGYVRQLVREAINRAFRDTVQTLEVYALDRDEGNDQLWEHILKTPPNTSGEVVLSSSPGSPLKAKGWRLPVPEARRALR